MDTEPYAPCPAAIALMNWREVMVSTSQYMSLAPPGPGPPHIIRFGSSPGRGTGRDSCSGEGHFVCDDMRSRSARVLRHWIAVLGALSRSEPRASGQYGSS
jgi:hypothetical protein